MTRRALKDMNLDDPLRLDRELSVKVEGGLTRPLDVTIHPLVRPMDVMPGAMAVGYDPKTRVVTILRGLWDTHRHLREALFRVTAPMTVAQFIEFDRQWYRERNRIG